MEMPRVVAGPKSTIGRWQCRRNKTWIELQTQEIHGRASYSFTTSWGANGVFGFISQRQAFERIENDRNLCSVNLFQVPVNTSAAAA